MIKLNNITATYTTVRGKVDAVDNVNITIPDGKIVGVAGESGCGKSTLLKVIYGDLIFPLALRKGVVEYEIKKSNGEGTLVTSKDIQDHWFKHISYIPQSSMSSLNPVVRIKKQFLDFMDREQRKAYPLDAIREYVQSLDLPPEAIDACPHEW